MPVDLTALDGTAAILGAFLVTFLGLIRAHLKKAEVLDERRVVADEKQATATGELVTEVRRLLDRMTHLEDRFEAMTPPLGRPIHPPQGPSQPTTYGPTAKRPPTSIR